MVQNRQQTDDWTLIGSGANGLGILELVHRNSQKLLKKTHINEEIKTKRVLRLKSAWSNCLKDSMENVCL